MVEKRCFRCFYCSLFIIPHLALLFIRLVPYVLLSYLSIKREFNPKKHRVSSFPSIGYPRLTIISSPGITSTSEEKSTTSSLYTENFKHNGLGRCASAILSLKVNVPSDSSVSTA